MKKGKGRGKEFSITNLGESVVAAQGYHKQPRVSRATVISLVRTLGHGPTATGTSSKSKICGSARGCDGFSMSEEQRDGEEVPLEHPSCLGEIPKVVSTLESWKTINPDGKAFMLL